MQQFRFRLQRILQWQERLCRIEEDKLRERLAEVAETENKLASLFAERAAIEEEFSAQTAMAPSDLRALAAFRRKTILDQQALEQESRKRRSALDAQRQKLLSERRRLQMIEKLRSRALEEHARGADRELEALSLESYLSTWISRS